MRVECYDISNLAGTLAVGSMVVFENGKANKNEYRKFKIKTVAGQNDVASLKEVLERRFNHAEWPLPDLIVLDGGKGQLKAAKGIDISVIALAKIGDKDGKLFTKFSKNYARLSKLPPNLSNFFLQIRDEAHRFAIGYNKQRREKEIKKKDQELNFL
jgi:excinuclease ABC subunit C